MGLQLSGVTVNQGTTWGIDEKISKLLCNSFCRYTTKKLSRIVGALGIMLERKIVLRVFR
jgi:hypothetical protein